VTAFAIDWRPERLTIAADSAAFWPVRGKAPRPVGTVTKMHAFPHLRAVLFSRGQHSVASAVAAMLAQDAQLQSVEAAAARLPEMLRLSVGCYAEAVGIADPGEYAMSEIYLAGWSAGERRMRLWSVDNLGFKLQDGGAHYGMFLVPQLPAAAMPMLAKCAVEQQLMGLMLAAHRFFAERPEIGMALGGEVVVCRLTPTSISQRVVGRLPGETRDAAFLARVERGEERVNVVDGLYKAAEMRQADAALAGR
jgi:hypothetical protein